MTLPRSVPGVAARRRPRIRGAAFNSSLHRLRAAPGTAS